MNHTQYCSLSFQEKRSIFPRFYFIGDDDLLEILGQATNPSVIQSHLKKLFAGIHSVQFNNDETEIVAMKSLEGEVVPLRKPVPISNEVEVKDSMTRIQQTHTHTFLLKMMNMQA